MPPIIATFCPSSLPQLFSREMGPFCSPSWQKLQVTSSRGWGILWKTSLSGRFCLVTLSCRSVEAPCLWPLPWAISLSSSWEQAPGDAEFLPTHSERQSLPWIVTVLRTGTGRENWASKRVLPDQAQPCRYIEKACTLQMNLLWFDIHNPLTADDARKRQGGFVSGGERLLKQGLTLLELWDTRDTRAKPPSHLFL